MAFRVKLQLCVALPPLLHTPDHTTPFLSSDCNVIAVPTLNCAEPVLPADTLRPAGLEVTVPLRPVAASVRVAAEVPPPQTFAMPPPHVCGALQPPQLSVAPQPSEIEPQFLPCAEQLIGVQPFPAFTVNTAFTVSPRDAEIVADTVPAENDVVWTVKLPLA